MDKTIELLVAATLLMIVASLVLFMTSDRTSSFSEFLGSQSSEAQCQLYQERNNEEAYNDDSNNCQEILGEPFEDDSDSNGGNNPGAGCGSYIKQENCPTSEGCVWHENSCQDVDDVFDGP